jgi:hypothetical protein
VDVADFSGQGGADLLWRHATSGSIRIWSLDGLALTGVHELLRVEEMAAVICPDTGTL